MKQNLKSVDEIPDSLGLPIIGNLIEVFRYRQLFYWRMIATLKLDRARL